MVNFIVLITFDDICVAHQSFLDGRLYIVRNMYKHVIAKFSQYPHYNRFLLVNSFLIMLR